MSVPLFCGVALTMTSAAQAPPCKSRPGGNPPERCRVIDKTPPPNLPGGVDDISYCFEHVSDADGESASTNAYRHWLINWHNTNILDAEWKKVNIDFREIAPRDCAWRMSSSGHPIAEDTDAPVKFGRIKDKLMIKNATAYVPGARAQSTSYPSVTGGVYAGLLLTRGRGQERFVVDVTTSSQFKANQVSLRIENRGNKNLIYSAPELVNRIGRESFDAAISKSTWTRLTPGSDWFRISDGTSIGTLAIDGISTASEEQIVLRFAAADAPEAVLGQASIPAYLPTDQR
jgi:hypothetical protein